MGANKNWSSPTFEGTAVTGSQGGAVDRNVKQTTGPTLVAVAANLFWMGSFWRTLNHWPTTGAKLKQHEEKPRGGRRRQKRTFTDLRHSDRTPLLACKLGPATDIPPPQTTMRPVRAKS